MRRPRSRCIVLLVALVLATAGCASLPTSGPVMEGAGATPTSAAAPFDFNPPGPRPGATPDEIVSGFLSALQATPVSTSVASEFLTPQAAEAWRPQRTTLVYGAQQMASAGRVVDVDLQDAFELDGRGRWAGRWDGDGSGRLRYRLTDDGGEWRIQVLPDALVVPRTHFESRYQEYSLFFLDPSGSVLVPEPVYLPQGVQAPTQLVAGLLDGPVRGAREVERSFFPDGTRVGVGVPIGTDGVARVPLSEEVLDLDETDLDLAAGQLAWTLGQLDGVDAFQMIVDGRAVELPGGESIVDVDAFSRLDPSVAAASPDLFGLRDRDVVQVVGEQEVAATSLSGPQARALGRPRSLGVDMASQRFALVGRGRREAVVVGRTQQANPRIVYTGTDLLRPMWDRVGDLWLVDRTARGSQVVVIDQGRSRVLRRWPVRGGPVRAAAVSRDGSRLVLAQRGEIGFRVIAYRVVRDGAGAPLRLTHPLELATAADLRQPVGLGWRDPTTIAVLTRPSAATTRVVLVSCDGASKVADFEPGVDTLFDRGVALAASPGGPRALYVAALSGVIHAMTIQGRWEPDAVDTGIRAPTFVG